MYILILLCKCQFVLLVDTCTGLHVGYLCIYMYTFKDLIVHCDINETFKTYVKFMIYNTCITNCLVQWSTHDLYDKLFYFQETCTVSRFSQDLVISWFFSSIENLFQHGDR